MKLSGLENNFIRFIVDDCLKFVEREYRRGNKYDAIVMDPPSYGSLGKHFLVYYNVFLNPFLIMLINPYLLCHLIEQRKNIMQ